MGSLPLTFVLFKVIHGLKLPKFQLKWKNGDVLKRWTGSVSTESNNTFSLEMLRIQLRHYMLSFKVGNIEVIS